MQEFDVALQTAVNVRTELWSMIAALPENMPFADIEIPLTFYENGHVIAWGDDSEHFRPSTFRLIQQLWLTPDHTLSKEDVCQDVIEDEYASNLAVRLVINKARKELSNVKFPYEIETLRGKGYRLKTIDLLHNPVTPVKTGG
jgi:DNA-binding response OmpR family regulator